MAEADEMPDLDTEASIPDSQSASPPPADTAAPSGGAPAAPQQFNFRESVSKRLPGVDLSGVENDEQIVDYLAEQAQLARQYGERMPAYQRLAQQVMPKWDAFQAWEAQQGAAKQPDPAKEEPDWPEPPEYDQRWDLALADPNLSDIQRENLRAKKQAYEEYRYKRIVELAEKGPWPHIQKPLEKWFADREKKIEERIRASLDGYKREQFATSVVMANRDKLYTLDQAGNPRLDQTGRPVLSQYGQLVTYQIDRLQQLGVQDEAQLWNLATEFAEMASRSMGHQVAPPPQPAAPDHRANYVQQALAGPAMNRTASLTGPQPQNPNPDFGAMLDAASREAGIAVLE